MIAIVDDDEAVRDSMASLVGSLGYAATAFASGEQFLAACALVAFGCVITDLHMPGLSGAELVLRIRALRPELPIIVVTAFPDSSLLRDPAIAGAAAVFSKPFAAAALATCLARLFPPPAPAGGATPGR